MSAVKTESAHTRGRVAIRHDFNALSEAGRLVANFGGHSSNLGDGGYAENTANARRFQALWNSMEGVDDPAEALRVARDLVETVDHELGTTHQGGWTVQQRERLQKALRLLGGRNADRRRSGL